MSGCCGDATRGRLQLKSLERVAAPDPEPSFAVPALLTRLADKPVLFARAAAAALRTHEKQYGRQHIKAVQPQC